MTASIDEKKQQYTADVSQVEGCESDKGLGVREELPEPDKEAFRRAMFKLDCCFLPAVTLIYFLSFLDVS